MVSSPGTPWVCLNPHVSQASTWNVSPETKWSVQVSTLRQWLAPQMGQGRSEALDMVTQDLVDPFKPGVGHERFGDADAFRCLIIFEQSGYDTGQGQGTAVQGVAELGFATLTFATALESVRLVALEVGNGADFQPALLGG